MTDTEKLKEALKRQYVGYGRPAEDRFLPRVWDGQHLYYPHFSEIGVLWDSETTDKVMNLAEVFGWHFDVDREKNAVCFNYILEACTGFKEKNGKLIYEGDLVYTIFSEKEILTVDWNEETGAFYAIGDKSAMGLYSRAYEVIGNIHEGVVKDSLTAESEGK